MKKILITGIDSFIGTSIEKYLSQWPEKYIVDTLDMEEENWRNKDFSGYDTVFHVAGIVHSDTGRVSKAKKNLYKKVNTYLTINTAQKAKTAGVKQFIFMSSSIVYGETPKVGKKRIITHDTKPDPENYYGLSKLNAEKAILKLDSIKKQTEKSNKAKDGLFKVVILRPPMIYGKGSKGNYPELSRIARKTPIFPYVNNCRSMLYVENLAEFVRLMIDNEERGIFYPQNKEYVNTSELVKTIREVHGKKTILIRGFTWLLKVLNLFTRKVNKAFGSWYYEQGMSEYKQEYRLVGFKESVRRTEQ